MKTDVGFTPSIDEIRRHWGLSVDVHRREERLAEFDRAIDALRIEAVRSHSRRLQAFEELRALDEALGILE